MGSKETLRRRVTEVADRRMIAANGTVQVNKIPGAMEKQFFLYLMRKHAGQGAKIVYEPHVFKIYDRNGNAESTTPDFLVEMPDGTRSYIEITTRELDGTDPKGRQKRIMSHFPEIDYRVLYRKDLMGIQEKDPRFSFWPAKKYQDKPLEIVGLI